MHVESQIIGQRLQEFLNMMPFVFINGLDCADGLILSCSGTSGHFALKPKFKVVHSQTKSETACRAHASAHECLWQDLLLRLLLVQ